MTTRLILFAALVVASLQAHAESHGFVSGQTSEGELRMHLGAPARDFQREITSSRPVFIEYSVRTAPIAANFYARRAAHRPSASQQAASEAGSYVVHVLDYPSHGRFVLRNGLLWYSILNVEGAGETLASLTRRFGSPTRLEELVQVDHRARVTEVFQFPGSTTQYVRWAGEQSFHSKIVR